MISHDSSFASWIKQLSFLFEKQRSQNPLKIAEFYSPSIHKEFHLHDGLFRASAYHFDRSYIVCLEKDISCCLRESINFLSELSKYLACKTYVKGYCPEHWKDIFRKASFNGAIHQSKMIKIEWLFEDDFNNLWEGPFLTIKKNDSFFIIERSFFMSVEKILALILEKKEKDLSQKKELLSKLTF